MSDYIKVSTSGIQEGRDSIQEEMREIMNSIEELFQGMQMLGTVWEGTAWKSFQNQVASDVERMKEICGQMKGYLQHIEYAEQEYRQCENKVEQLVNSIRI